MSSKLNTNLILAKALFFCTAMASVGWSRFQNNFFLDRGLLAKEIGNLKSVGLIFKFIGEPLWCLLADFTDPKVVFAMCIGIQLITLEVQRTIQLVTFNKALLIKLCRTATAPSSTLTTTASLALIEGSGQSYGQQRMFGSMAWGVGAALVGMLIDLYTMDAMFIYSYFFYVISLVLVLVGLPPKFTLRQSSSSSNQVSSAVGDTSTSGISISSRSEESNDSQSYLMQSFEPVSAPLHLSFRSYATSLQGFFGTFVHFVSHPSCRALFINMVIYGTVSFFCFGSLAPLSTCPIFPLFFCDRLWLSWILSCISVWSATSAYRGVSGVIFIKIGGYYNYSLLFFLLTFFILIFFSKVESVRWWQFVLVCLAFGILNGS